MNPSDIEHAICERLQAGLGRMVDSVQSYGGELDGNPHEIIRVLPGAWVTFGGIHKTEKTNTTGRKFRDHARFAVIVADRNIRSETASRHGGVLESEVGTNLLVTAVRRLLTGQSLGLKISCLTPGRVRSLFNTQLEQQAVSAFACEFDTSWIYSSLDDSRFPETPLNPAGEVDITHPDYPFTRYRGAIDEPYPDLKTIKLKIDEVNTPLNPDLEGQVTYD
ncbi:DUF1834 family protein [Limnobaculum zhutongyuii]|uniref:DUF1834 family protein n=1 Tax=Limnobaculum zhutongyuii TaxID=2498113 RepID=A0A411WHA8_9GAMM|nr:DUF1834 family protein [Limnobaculum zhutongyuii]QBH95466.1 DUF1834 family protein [Limnobaculum zhutongyuii]TQS88845.1 DUF1834 family protein [Limnobaculum zhutongyuii]